MRQVLLQGKPVALEGKALEIDQKVPDFNLVGVDLKDKTLSDFQGKFKVLYFVPSLDTGTCSLSTKRFNQELQNKNNVAVLVISGDLPFAQKRWCGLEGASHITPLSSFRDKTALTSYGVLVKEGPLEGLCTRAVFVVNPENKLIYQEIVSEISQEPDYAKVLSALA